MFIQVKILGGRRGGVAKKKKNNKIKSELDHVKQ